MSNSEQIGTGTGQHLERAKSLAAKVRAAADAAEQAAAEALGELPEEVAGIEDKRKRQTAERQERHRQKVATKHQTELAEAMAQIAQEKARAEQLAGLVLSLQQQLAALNSPKAGFRGFIARLFGL